MTDYFLKYSYIFEIIDFNKHELPPHLFYYIHSGHKASTDIDLRKVIPFVTNTFFGSDEKLLKNTPVNDLKSKILMLHDNLVDIPESGYRQLMAYVKFADPPADPATYLRNKYKNLDVDVEEKIKIIKKFRDDAIRIAQEIVLDLATRENKELYSNLVKIFMRYIYQLAKEKFPEIIRDNKIDSATLEKMPAVKRELIRLFHLNPEAKQDFEKIFEQSKQYMQSSQVLCEEYNLRQGKEAQTELLLNADPGTRETLLDFFREYQFVTVLPNRIEVEMENFFNTLAKKLSEGEDPFIIAAWTCLEYTRIHPKNNGNGRASRFLANLILMQHGIIPVIFDNDSEYTQKIRAANNDIKIFAQYLYEMALQSAWLYQINSVSYSEQFQHFSEYDLATLDAFKLHRKVLSTLGMINTYGKERRDYDPQEVLSREKATVSENVSPIQKIFTVVEQAAKREYSVNKNYQLAKMLYQDALKLRLQIRPSNVAVAVLYVNIANCCEKLQDSVDERIENLTRAQGLIKSDPAQEGLLTQINKKLTEYTEEKRLMLEAAEMNESTAKLTLNAR